MALEFLILLCIVSRISTQVRYLIIFIINFVKIHVCFNHFNSFDFYIYKDF